MKNYLIIGASSGIGKAIALHLAAEGNNVLGTFNEHNAQPSAPNLHFHQLNVLDAALNLDFVPETLDGMVYCPGSINLRPFHRIKPEAFIEDYQLQVVGAIKVIQAVLPHLKKAEQSSVVLFSTVAVQTGFTFHSQVAASKGAVEGLGKALAAELAPRIRVNIVAPSLTDTPLASKLLSTEDKKAANAKRHPLQRVGEANDAAQMAAFLLSDKTSWVTGQVFPVDGGMSTIRM